MWEDTSFQLERLQANELYIKQEEEGLSKRTQPYFKLTFNPSEMPTISQPGISDLLYSRIGINGCFYYEVKHSLII